MNSSSLILEYGSTEFKGWINAAIDFDIESVVTNFSFTAYDKDNVLAGIETGFPITVWVVNGDTKIQVVDGFVTERTREINQTLSSSTFTGSDKLVDLVECSTLVKNRSWVKARFSKIVKDVVAPFDAIVDFSDMTDDPVIDKMVIQSGETAFEVIERLSRSQAVLPVSTLAGTLKFTHAANVDTRSAVDLVVGENVMQLRETVNWDERFSEYIGISQTTGNGKRWTKEMVQNKATAIDRGVTRYRPKLFFAESKEERQTLTQRVNWEAQVRAGRALDYTCVVDGWFQKGTDLLWEKNKRVTLKYDAWDLSIDMIIASVSYVIGDSGEQTTLTLRHPDTYKKDPSDEVDLT